MLRSANRDFELDIQLVPLSGRDAEGWISYILCLRQTANGNELRLATTEDVTLFFESRYEPEIPAMCEGLRKIANEPGRFVFEPIDERDFCLDVHHAEHIVVRVTLADIQASDDWGWPLGQIVEKSELERFADELEEKYAIVRGGNKGDLTLVP